MEREEQADLVMGLVESVAGAARVVVPELLAMQGPACPGAREEVAIRVAAVRHGLAPMLLRTFGTTLH